MTVSDPGVRLVLAHHAGGSRLLYRGWERRLPAGWEVVALDAPGRGFEHDVPASRDIDGIVDSALDRVLDGLDRPLALFGHSMGAAVVSRMANRLHGAGAAEPVWLGLSGWAAQPGVGAAAVRAMSDDDVRRFLSVRDGTPAPLLHDPDFWPLICPLLRANLEALARFDPMAGRAWLELPLSLFGGRDDPQPTGAQLAVLGSRAQRLVATHVHPGGHFYLTDAAGDVTQQIASDIDTALGRRTRITPGPVPSTKGS